MLRKLVATLLFVGWVSLSCFDVVEDLDQPICEVYGGAAGYLEDCRTLIIRVATDNGIEGWGEATQGRPGNTYETLETMEIMVRKYFAPALIGTDLDLTGAVVAKLQAVRYGHPITKAGVETAIYDAVGKTYGVPDKYRWR